MKILRQYCRIYYFKRCTAPVARIFALCIPLRHHRAAHSRNGNCAGSSFHNPTLPSYAHALMFADELWFWLCFPPWPNFAIPWDVECSHKMSVLPQGGRGTMRGCRTLNWQRAAEAGRRAAASRPTRRPRTRT